MVAGKALCSVELHQLLPPPSCIPLSLLMHLLRLCRRVPVLAAPYFRSSLPSGANEGAREARAVLERGFDWGSSKAVHASAGGRRWDREKGVGRKREGWREKESGTAAGYGSVGRQAGWILRERRRACQSAGWRRKRVGGRWGSGSTLVRAISMA
eukprot:3765202-Rhodomonas_salina.2